MILLEPGENRTIVRLTPRVVAKADHMLAKIPEPYHMEENRHLDLVFQCSQMKILKERRGSMEKSLTSISTSGRTDISKA